jgi:imidazolonepropionase
MGEIYGGTVPVGLPGTSYFLGIPYAPARALIGAGLPFAMASDFNPGSSPIASLQVVWALGCTQMKLLPAEAFHAITCNAARALRCENEVGTLACGQRADFITTKTQDAIKAIPYFMGQNHCYQVYINGKVAHG